MGLRRPTVAPSRSKPTRRRVRQALRRHQRDRPRPWCAPNPGEIGEELNCGGSWSTSRPPRLPDAAAASSARVGFLFGVLRRPLRVHRGRQGYSSSASGRRRPLPRDRHDRGQAPIPPACPGAATGRRGLCIRRWSPGRGRAAATAPGRGRGGGGRVHRASAAGGRRRNARGARTRPLRVGRRYPAAAPDGSPSRPWDSGVRPAPPSPSSSPSQHSGRRRTWAGAGRAFGHAAPADLPSSPPSRHANTPGQTIIRLMLNIIKKASPYNTASSPSHRRRRGRSSSGAAPTCPPPRARRACQRRAARGAAT